MLDHYRRKHVDRLIENNMDLWKQTASICLKCHDIQEICCLFCYCPLYPDPSCGGEYTITDNGSKSCSTCILPHTRAFARELYMRLYYMEE